MSPCAYCNERRKSVDVIVGTEAISCQPSAVELVFCRNVSCGGFGFAPTVRRHLDCEEWRQQVSDSSAPYPSWRGCVVPADAPGTASRLSTPSNPTPWKKRTRWYR